MDERFLPLGIAAFLLLAVATWGAHRHKDLRPIWVLELLLAAAWGLMLAAVQTGYKDADIWPDCGSGSCSGLPSIAPWVLFLFPVLMALVLVLGGFVLRRGRRSGR